MELNGRRIVVMGLGRFGGGVGVTRFLAERGARVLVTDTADPVTLEDSLAKLDGLNVDLRLGEHREADFAGADMVVVNPAVKPGDNRYLRAAREAGAELTSEMGLLVGHLPGRHRTIGITGTAGKSTVTAMIGHVLSEALGKRRVHVGGNLGGSLLSRLDAIGPDDPVVLELSSFMLERLRDQQWSPAVAVVTNLTANHLDWHGSFEAYAAAKQVMLAHQRPGDRAVIRGRAERHLTLAPGVNRIEAAEAMQAVSAITMKLPGEHNRDNAVTATMAVLAATLHAAGLDADRIARSLAAFPGLPHRLQLAGQRGGVRCFNDSKSTTPDAVRQALACFPPGTVHLILGGRDKGSDLPALAADVAATCRGVYTIGETGPALAQAVSEAGGVAHCVQTLDAATAAATAAASPGEVVVLSPGFASMDQFHNYEHRGQAFIEALYHHGFVAETAASAHG